MSRTIRLNVMFSVLNTQISKPFNCLYIYVKISQLKILINRISFSELTWLVAYLISSELVKGSTERELSRTCGVNFRPVGYTALQRLHPLATQ